ncbi:MAG: hypothetical protein H8E11_03025 [Candidatus Cloacimonetes bacterium]|nr:hypothetical protein [Candidatus Cloacimonadota bacterium]
MNKFTWSDAIIEVLNRHNFIASLKMLHQEAPKIYSNHNRIIGKTPFKTINERVQRDARIVKIVPGIYTLLEKINILPKEYNPKLQSISEKEKLNHISIQALLLQLGKIYNFDTYTPDKSKKYLNKNLYDFTTLINLPDFTYNRILKRIKMVDVIWFNDRGFPINVFEVENTTDMKNALSKFMELMDFNTKMTIVSPLNRENEFTRIMNQPAFKPISKRTLFWSYEKVEKLYNSEQEIYSLRSELY